MYSIFRPNVDILSVKPAGANITATSLYNVKVVVVVVVVVMALMIITTTILPNILSTASPVSTLSLGSSQNSTIQNASDVR
jgi:hypothetical protein